MRLSDSVISRSIFDRVGLLLLLQLADCCPQLFVLAPALIGYSERYFFDLLLELLVFLLQEHLELGEAVELSLQSNEFGLGTAYLVLRASRCWLPSAQLPVSVFSTSLSPQAVRPIQRSRAREKPEKSLFIRYISHVRKLNGRVPGASRRKETALFDPGVWLIRSGGEISTGNGLMLP